MSWNYRVMAQMDGDDVYLNIHTVYYTDNIPDRYSELPSQIGGSTLSEVEFDIDMAKRALSKPILWSGHRFPEEYKP